MRFSAASMSLLLSQLPGLREVEGGRQLLGDHPMSQTFEHGGRMPGAVSDALERMLHLVLVGARREPALDADGQRRRVMEPRAREQEHAVERADRVREGG